jgi:hypothetical protein
LKPEVLKELREIVGAQNVLSEPEQALSYECDGFAFQRHTPDACDAVSSIIASGIIPAALEMIDHRADRCQGSCYRQSRLPLADPGRSSDKEPLALGRPPDRAFGPSLWKICHELLELHEIKITNFLV